MTATATTLPHAHASAFDVAALRAEFPALRRQEGGRPVAYFDGPGGTQVPRGVVDAMSDYLFHHNANTHWDYPTSHETDAMIAGARAAYAEFFNGTPEEVVFGNNMTSLAFHLSRALGRGFRDDAGVGHGRPFGPEDEIVVTELDHHGNVAPWQALARERGVTIRMAKADVRTGRIDWDDLASLLGARTRLLAIGAASNALGAITDVTRAAAMARDVGALTFVDAVHFAPHELVDVRAIGCDFLACSAYKFYGPHVGILWGRAELLSALDAPKLDPAPDTAPERLELGTQNHEGIVGAHAAVDFLAGLGGAIDAGPRRARLARGFAALHAKGQRLLTRLWDGLGAIDGVVRFGPEPGQRRTPTVSFTVADIPSQEVAARLAERGVYVSHGDFYAWTVVERLGLATQGLVRAGCAAYTTMDEIECLLAGVREVSTEVR